jgi:RNA-directed DNA polymerase
LSILCLVTESGGKICHLARHSILALHPTKTRLIRFGRHAAKQREELGEGRPEPFDFLGFTHFCTRSRKWGSFVIGRKTIKKRMLKQLQAVKMELRRRMHDPIAKTGAWLNQMGG